MRVIGLLIVAVLLALPLVEFVPLLAKYDSTALFSQYIGCAALIAMAIGQFLATRISVVEPIFGGLDRVYVLHKWLGIGALVAVLLHDTVDAEIDGIGRETWLTDIAETLGEFSLYGFIILILITIVTFIPYHLWRWSHKLMGTFFALSAFHFAFMIKPIANTDFTGLYVLAICAIGLASYLYTLLPDRYGKSSVPYSVEHIEQTGDAVAINLKPDGKGIKHHSGQFAFISFDLPHLDEVHPFTISTSPKENKTLQFTIKPMGDYTGKLLRQIKVGTKANLSPAYGHFRLRKHAGGQIWIAAGIGITPFKAWLEQVTPEHGQIDLFYCVRGRKNAPHLRTLEAQFAKLDNAQLHVFDSLTDPRLNASAIAEKVGAELRNHHAYFCGPATMRDALQQELKTAGLSNRKFHFEEFEIRSGIGIRKLFAYAIQKFGLSQRYREALAKLS